MGVPRIVCYLTPGKSLTFPPLGKTIMQSKKWLTAHNLKGYIARLVSVTNKS
jgi:hypothetical protein